MSTLERQAHWQNVYQTKDEQAVSWYQERPDVSLDLIHATGVDANASIVDIGGGASRLVDALISEGFKSVAVLDLSEKALVTSKARLGAKTAQVEWIVADVTNWEPPQTYDVWHDRAAFHFLTDPKDRAAYIERVLKAVRIGGHVIIGTFAPDGPERCSGLPVIRYDAATLGLLLGPSFALAETRRHDHQTPSGVIQKFSIQPLPTRSMMVCQTCPLWVRSGHVQSRAHVRFCPWANTPPKRALSDVEALATLRSGT